MELAVVRLAVVRLAVVKLNIGHTVMELAIAGCQLWDLHLWNIVYVEFAVVMFWDLQLDAVLGLAVVILAFVGQNVGDAVVGLAVVVHAVVKFAILGLAVVGLDMGHEVVDVAVDLEL